MKDFMCFSRKILLLFNITTVASSLRFVKKKMYYIFMCICLLFELNILTFRPNFRAKRYDSKTMTAVLCM